MSEVLRDLIRDRQLFVESQKYRPNVISALINIAILLLTGFSIYIIIENPVIARDIIKMFV